MFDMAPGTDVTGNKGDGTSEGHIVGRGCFTFWLCMYQFHSLIPIQTSKFAEQGEASAFLVPALEPSQVIKHTSPYTRPTPDSGPVPNLFPDSEEDRCINIGSLLGQPGKECDRGMDKVRGVEDGRRMTLQCHG